MGSILETPEGLVLEERRESYYIGEGKEYEKKAEHIFAIEDGYIEMSKEFLNRLIEFFERDTARRANLRDGKEYTVESVGRKRRENGR